MDRIEKQGIKRGTFPAPPELLSPLHHHRLFSFVALDVVDGAGQVPSLISSGLISLGSRRKLTRSLIDYN